MQTLGPSGGEAGGGGATARDDGAVGIEPVPAGLRRLRAVDVGVLWGDLAVGVLVLAAGALMVTPTASGGLGFDFRTALIAIVVGSLAGSLLLALVGLVGHDAGVPTMVLLRPVLGTGGSYLASLVNVVQLVGWTAFEFWAMALFASHVSDEVFGFHGFTLWLLVVATGCTILALLGPIRVVQAWLEKAGIWIVLVTCGYLTIYLLTKIDVGSLLTARHSGVSFGLGVDLVVAQPVSWLPLVADYNRFSAHRRQNFFGTLGGYSLGNVWFYGLGALLVLGAKLHDPSPAGIAAAVLGLSAGGVVGTLLLLSLLAGETDEAFADIYSSVVSAQNIVPRLPRRTAVVAVGVAGAVIAEFVTVGNYQTFLFLLGSVFVPLFAVLLADWCAGALQPRSSDSALGRRSLPTFRPGMTLVWLLGIGVYHWIVPTGPSWWTDIVNKVPGAGHHTFLGASLPCFVVTFVSALIVASLFSPERRAARLR